MNPQAVADLLLSRHGQPDFSSAIKEAQPYLTAEVVVALKEGVDAEKWRNPQRAWQIAQVAEAVAGVLADSPSSALAHWAQGTALYYLSRYGEALDHFRRAEIIYRQLQDWPAVARLLVGQIAMLTEIGDYQAIAGLEAQARATCQKLGGEAARCLAGLEMNIGAAYEQMGDLEAALAAYQRGREHFAALGNAAQVARIDINRAVVLEQLDRFLDAEQALLAARSALASADHGLEVARADLNLGVLAYRRGQYQAALQHLETAYSGFAAIPNPNEIATVNLYRSFVYRDLNLLEDQLLLASQAEQTFAQDGIRWQQTLAIINQGIGYWRLGAFAKAEEKLEQACDLLHRLGAHNRLLMLDLERAFLALEQGRVDQARSLGQQVAEQAQSLDWPMLAARTHLLLARCALTATPSRLAEARERAELALTEANAHALRDASIEANYLLGQILEASNDPSEAWDRYKTAILAIEDLQAGLPLDEFRMGFLDDKLPIYQAVVRLSQQHGSPAQVLHALNQAQTAPLLRLMPAGVSGRPGDGDLLTQLHALRETWHWYQTKLEGQGAVQAGAAREMALPRRSRLRDYVAEEVDLRQRLQDLEGQIADLARRWRVRTAEASGAGNGQVHAAGDWATTERSPLLDAAECLLADIQAALGQSAALLYYYEIDGQMQALLVTGDAIRLTGSLTATQPLQRLLRSWRFHLEHVRGLPAGAQPAMAQPLLARFYDLLVEPLAADLAGIGQIYLVLPPAWHDLPVSAFFDGRDYLVERFVLAHISAPEVLLNRQASPIFPGAGSDGLALIIGYSDSGRLPHAVAEARQVAAAVSPQLAPRLLLELDATRESFLTQCRSSRVLHLATHATFRPDNPLFSWIRLADAYLTVAELYEVTLPQRPLVVLSACETGRGRPRGGGLLGMGRGFLAAGAAGLVVSLWKVADQAAAQLMADFYGGSPCLAPAAAAAALNLAQRRAAASQLHPFFWAGLIFIQG